MTINAVVSPRLSGGARFGGVGDIVVRVRSVVVVVNQMMKREKMEVGGRRKMLTSRNELLGKK